MLRITLKKSPIGHNPRNRKTIQSLGIHKVGQTVEHEDTPTIRGMIYPVQQLLVIEEVEGEPTQRKHIAKTAKAASKNRSAALSETSSSVETGENA